MMGRSAGGGGAAALSPPTDEAGPGEQEEVGEGSLLPGYDSAQRYRPYPGWAQSYAPADPARHRKVTQSIGFSQKHRTPQYYLAKAGHALHASPDFADKQLGKAKGVVRKMKDCSAEEKETWRREIRVFELRCRSSGHGRRAKKDTIDEIMDWSTCTQRSQALYEEAYHCMQHNEWTRAKELLTVLVEDNAYVAIDMAEVEFMFGNTMRALQLLNQGINEHTGPDGIPETRARGCRLRACARFLVHNDVEGAMTDARQALDDARDRSAKQLPQRLVELLSALAGEEKSNHNNKDHEDGNRSPEGLREHAATTSSRDGLDDDEQSDEDGFLEDLHDGCLTTVDTLLLSILNAVQMLHRGDSEQFHTSFAEDILCKAPETNIFLHVLKADGWYACGEWEKYVDAILNDVEPRFQQRDDELDASTLDQLHTALYYLERYPDCLDRMNASVITQTSESTQTGRGHRATIGAMGVLSQRVLRANCALLLGDLKSALNQYKALQLTDMDAGSPINAADVVTLLTRDRVMFPDVAAVNPVSAAANAGQRAVGEGNRDGASGNNSNNGNTEESNSRSNTVAAHGSSDLLRPNSFWSLLLARQYDTTATTVSQHVHTLEQLPYPAHASRFVAFLLQCRAQMALATNGQDPDIVRLLDGPAPGSGTSESVRAAAEVHMRSFRDEDNSEFAKLLWDNAQKSLLRAIKIIVTASKRMDVHTWSGLIITLGRVEGRSTKEETRAEAVAHFQAVLHVSPANKCAHRAMEEFHTRRSEWPQARDALLAAYRAYMDVGVMEEYSLAGGWLATRLANALRAAGHAKAVVRLCKALLTVETPNADSVEKAIAEMNDCGDMEAFWQELEQTGIQGGPRRQPRFRLSQDPQVQLRQLCALRILVETCLDHRRPASAFRVLMDADHHGLPLPTDADLQGHNADTLNRALLITHDHLICCRRVEDGIPPEAVCAVYQRIQQRYTDKLDTMRANCLLSLPHESQLLAFTARGKSATGDYAASEALLQQALKRSPHDAVLHRDMAEAMYDMVVDQYPSNRARVEAAEEHFATARELSNEAFALPPPVEFVVHYILCDLEFKHTDDTLVKLARYHGSSTSYKKRMRQVKALESSVALCRKRSEAFNRIYEGHHIGVQLVEDETLQRTMLLNTLQARILIVEAAVCFEFGFSSSLSDTEKRLQLAFSALDKALRLLHDTLRLVESWLEELESRMSEEDDDGAGLPPEQNNAMVLRGGAQNNTPASNGTSRVAVQEDDAEEDEEESQHSSARSNAVRAAFESKTSSFSEPSTKGLYVILRENVNRFNELISQATALRNLFHLRDSFADVQRAVDTQIQAEIEDSEAAVERLTGQLERLKQKSIAGSTDGSSNTSNSSRKRAEDLQVCLEHAQRSLDRAHAASQALRRKPQEGVQKETLESVYNACNAFERKLQLKRGKYYHGRPLRRALGKVGLSASLYVPDEMST